MSNVKSILDINCKKKSLMPFKVGAHPEDDNVGCNQLYIYIYMDETRLLYQAVCH
jgi:hypothetical protein